MAALRSGTHVFVGIKMGLGHTSYKLPTTISFVVVVLILAAAVSASLLSPKRAHVEAPHRRK